MSEEITPRHATTQRSPRELRRATMNIAVTVLTVALITIFVIGASLVAPAVILTSEKTPAHHASPHASTVSVIQRQAGVASRANG
jgi:amino acid permease